MAPMQLADTRRVFEAILRGGLLHNEKSKWKSGANGNCFSFSLAILGYSVCAEEVCESSVLRATCTGVLPLRCEKNIAKKPVFPGDQLARFRREKHPEMWLKSFCGF